MDSPRFNIRIWLEATIAGFLYVAAAFFFLQSWFAIHELNWLTSSLLPYVASILIAASYVLGLTLHSLVPSIFRVLIPPELWGWLRSGIPFDAYQKTAADNVKLAMHGSQELLIQMKGIYSSVVLFRLLTPGVFLFGFSLASWCMDTTNQRYSPMILMISSILSIAFLCLYREYFSRYANYEAEANIAMSVIPSFHQTKRRRPRRAT